MKKLVTLLLAALMCFSMVACGAKDEPANDPAQKDQSVVSNPGSQETVSNKEDNSQVLEQVPIVTSSTKLDAKTRIVCVLKNTVNPFWVEVQQGCVEAGEALGIKVDVVAPVVSNNNEEQIQLIEQASIEGCDALCVAPADSSGIAPAIEVANDSEIPVINFNTRIFDSNIYNNGPLDVVTFVATENYDVAYETAVKMVEMMGEAGNVVILEGPTGGQVSIDRVAGCTDLVSEYPNVQIIDSQTANDSRSEAMSVTQDLLQKHSDVKAIFAANGEMGLGAAEACIQAGRTDILIALIDMNEEICAALNNGKIHIANDGIAYNQGYYAVVAAYNQLAGESVPTRVELTSRVVTTDNIAPYLEKYGIG